MGRLTRTEILAETVARLEAERFAGSYRWELYNQPPPDVAPHEAADNARTLIKALHEVESLPQVHPHSVDRRSA